LPADNVRVYRPTFFRAAHLPRSWRLWFWGLQGGDSGMSTCGPSEIHPSTPHLPPDERLAARTRDGVLLVARALLTWIFLQGGTSKLMALDAFSASLARAGVPLPDVVAPLAAAVEFFGGLALLLGLQARTAALLMALFVICASAVSHRYWELVDPALRRTQSVQFWKNACIIGGFLLLFVAGAGRFSLDGWLRRR
jgi:putative oxidoreductase